MRTFQESSEPQNGDCKVVYEYAADGFECSFIVQQIVAKGDTNDVCFGVDRANVIDHKCFGKCPGGDDYGDIWMVRRGNIG